MRPMHITICGYPRAGTSLIQHMLQVSLGPNFVSTMGDEISALDAVGIDERSRVTKRPLDIFRIGNIRRKNKNGFNKQLIFLLMVRDPRFVLTSRHEKVNGKYLIRYDMGGVESAGLVATHKSVIHHKNDGDCLVVKYEYMINSLQAVEDKLKGFGVPIIWPMADYVKVEQYHPGEQQKPLHRPLSTARKGLTPGDQVYLNRQIAECPYINQMIEDFGYDHT